MPFTGKKWKVGRSARDETSCSKDFLISIVHWTISLVWWPWWECHFTCFLMNMVGWLLMRPPILHLPNYKIINEICKYFSFHIALSYLFIKDGSTLLKSRDGGRSLNISIEKVCPYSYSINKNQRELWRFREEPTW